MKDSMLTVRVTRATRQRLERLARREGRSLSGQVERLLEQSLDDEATPTAPRSRTTRRLAGLLAGARVPTLADFRAARAALSASLLAHTGRHEKPGR